MIKTEKRIDDLAKELGVDKYAPGDPMNDKSLFGNTPTELEDLKKEDLKEVDGREWLKHNPPLDTPVFFSSPKEGKNTGVHN